MRKRGVDILMIQESKWECVDSRKAVQHWGRGEVGFAFLPSFGMSRYHYHLGQKKVVVGKILEGAFSLTIRCKWGESQLWGANIYGPVHNSLKENFWVELDDVMGWELEAKAYMAGHLRTRTLNGLPVPSGTHEPATPVASPSSF
ncbi:hypothetical protein IFM89_014311 [Coptis chinensis]|uniref:Uncharacterized protein n=1 Tax=Coptis chinensis TaxID=261450 RepID=A0A835LR95_9MAGN|nr:hypothetical protein IFM89_014311 [Coptis chinensis]